MPKDIKLVSFPLINFLSHFNFERENPNLRAWVGDLIKKDLKFGIKFVDQVLFSN